MPTETTYTRARAHFAALCDEAASTGEAVIIHRRGAEDVALVSAAELHALQATAHLLRSPKNVMRLQRALSRARRGIGARSSVAKIAREVGLARK